MSGSRVPPSLKRIEVTAYLGGKSFNRTFLPLPNQTAQFTWDGRDPYGRLVQGRWPAVMSVAYVYDLVYRTPAAFFVSWARFGTTPLAASRSANEVRLSRYGATWVEVQRNAWVGGWDARALKLGGWSLSEHHVYDPSGHLLLPGEGGRRSAFGVSPVLQVVAGTGAFGFSGDGGPATLADFEAISDVAVDSAGRIYIADSARVRRIDRAGIVTTVAGGAEDCPERDDEDRCVDGIPALDMPLGAPEAIAIGPDGSIFIADSGANCVWRVAPGGLIYDYAGICGEESGQQLVARGKAFADCEDCPATGVSLGGPQGVAVDSEGVVYIADTGNDRIRRVDPSGMIRTYVNTGPFPGGIELGPDGSLYIAEPSDSRVRKVDPTGRISTVAGGQSGYGYCGDGGPAVEACLAFPFDVAVASDGKLLIADADNGMVRLVDGDGMIRRIAGAAPEQGATDRENGDFASAVALSFVVRVAVLPDGNYLLVSGNQVLAAKPLLPGYAGTEISIASADGREVYIFDSRGRHLETKDALTNAVKRRFTYDEHGLLLSIEDQDGLKTRIERGSGGEATGIVSPAGVRTALTVGTSGYLAAIENPAGESTTFTYTPQGLLTSMSNAQGDTSTYSYLGFGRLVKVEDAVGGFKTLQRENITSSSYKVTQQTALGHTVRYLSELFDNGVRRDARTRPDGLARTLTTAPDGSRTAVFEDGMIIVTDLRPDPRWGQQASYSGRTEITTPLGLHWVSTTQRTVELSDPLDRFSIGTIVESRSVNGRLFTTRYDGATRRWTVTSPMGRSLAVTSDRFGRPVSATLLGLQPLQIERDTRGRTTALIQSDGSVERRLTLSYDSNDRLTSFTNPAEQGTAIAYDAAGRITSVRAPDASELRLGYDRAGNTVSVGPPGRPDHNFSFSPVHLLEGYVPPPAGGGGGFGFQYNLDRQIVGLTRGDGSPVDFSYTPTGRLARISTVDGDYALGYDGAGRLGQLVGPGSEGLTFAYDGSVMTSVTWAGPVAGTVGQSYDDNFWIRQEHVNGSSVSFTYDLDGFVTRAGDLSIARDAASGRVVGTELGVVATTHVVDGFGDVTAETVSAAGTPLMTVSYQRDSLGRVATKDERIGGMEKRWDYEYDAAGRLAKVRLAGALHASYSYDVNGNRTASTDAWGTHAAVYDAQDRLITYDDAMYEYDADGRLARRSEPGGQVQYHYDVFGNLRTVLLADGIAIDYVIDGLNRRVGKKVNGVLAKGWLYTDQIRPVAELDGDGALTTRFVYGTGRGAPDYMIRAGTMYRFVLDQVGSVRLVIDAGTGQVVHRLDYDPFGRVMLDSNPGFQPFGFAGGLYDIQTGLVRFGARDYDPETGRWTARDPIGFRGGDTNLYGYVIGDPINATDAFGLSPGSSGWCFVKGLAIGVVGAVAIGAVAAGVAAVGVPVAAVTIGLGVVAIVGAAALGVDVAQNIRDSNWDGLAYNAGSVVGGIVAGGATGRGVAEGINGTRSPPWSVKSDWSQRYKPDLGTVGDWFGTGPNPGSAAGSTAVGGAGGASTVKGPCGCG